jgi:ribonuclease HI
LAPPTGAHKPMKKASFIKDFKPYLPSTRERIHALRANRDSPPTLVQSEMGELIKKSWGDQCAKAPCSLPGIKNFLQHYHKKLNKDLFLTPDMPLTVRAILGSGDSSSGPDGIPFVAYRTLIDYAGPLLLALINHSIDGHPLPPKFNFGLLHLIPKSKTLLPEDTRPITVGNSDNRVLARIMVSCITPAIQEFIRPEQKLFVPGRVMTDLVVDINELYYSHLSKKHQYLLLFLDTKKAFDSIHHDYLMELLHHIGCPPWFLSVVKELLSLVMVSPVLANMATLLIPILRGLKQGCPLSPILFVICFDPLLEYISNNYPTTKIFAAADDLALGDVILETLFSIMNLITDFSIASGLGINFSKSAILPTIPDITLADKALLSPWPEIQVVSRYTHLGVLTGHDVWTEDIFHKAHLKAMSRLTRYTPVLRKLPIHKRSLIINTFITPIYMYLGALFVIPPDYEQEYRAAVSRVVIPFGGTAFKYHHLLPSYPPLHFKPHLRDLWSSNVSALANRYNFDPYFSPDPPPLDPGIAESSCRISEHISFASTEYLVWRMNSDPALRHESLQKETSSRGSLYHHLVRYAYQEDTKKDWVVKLGKIGITHEASLSNLSKNFGQVASTTPDYARTIFLSFLLKAIPTSTRLRFFPGTGPVLDCPFCLGGVDDFRHFMSGCPALWESLTESSMGVSGGFSEVLPSRRRRFRLLTNTLSGPVDSPGKKEVIHCIIAFVCGTLFARRRVLAQGNPGGLSEFMDAHIKTYFLNLSRKSRARARAILNAIRAIISIPATSTIVYTDGSASPNPGPSGAGAWICPPSSYNSCLFRALGHGSNNIGELWAIGMAIAFLIEEDNVNDVVICTDSEYSIGVLSLGHQPKTLLPLITKIQENMASAKFLCSFIWVPGHSDIEGNEIADRLAGMGTRISTKEEVPSLYPNIIDLSWRICAQTPIIESSLSSE